MKLLYAIYAFVAFLLVSLDSTYKFTSGIFNGGKLDEVWKQGTISRGTVLHGLVLVLLLWLPGRLKKFRNKKDDDDMSGMTGGGHYDD